MCSGKAALDSISKFHENIGLTPGNTCRRPVLDTSLKPIFAFWTVTKHTD